VVVAASELIEEDSEIKSCCSDTSKAGMNEIVAVLRGVSKRNVASIMSWILCS
jgi:hypothetical protein